MLPAPARNSDIPALLELAASVRGSFPDYNAAGYLQTFRRNINRGSVLCIRSRHGIAAALIYSPTHTAIGYLAVCHSMRCRGLGTALMQAAIAALGSGRSIYLHVLRKDDQPDSPLYRFYTRQGFSPAQEETVEGILYRRWNRPAQAMEAEQT